MKKNIANIKEKVERHKTLIQNFSYLSALQIFNMLLPLITYPYLIRTLGKETYGLVVFAQAIVTYLVTLVSFGFNISGTHEISVHRHNKEKLSEILSTILILKGLLFVLAFIILCFILVLVPQASSYNELFLLTMYLCIYDIVFPIWYFQGIEQMKYITYITIVSRLFFLGSIFLFIHEPSDYLFVPLLYGVGSLTAGGISLFIIFVRHKIKFKWQSFRKLKYYFIQSVPFFISNISISIYVGTNKIISGAFLGMGELAYFDLAEKLTAVFKMPQGILSQSLFPKISKEKNIGFVKRIFNLSIITNVILLIMILFGSKYIILLLGGEHMLPAQTVLIILSFSVPLIAMSNIFGIQLLIPFGYVKEFRWVILASGIIYLIQLLILWLTLGFSLINISIITVTTELFGTSYMFYFCRKNNLWK